MFASLLVKVIENQLKCLQYSVWTTQIPNLRCSWSERNIHNLQRIPTSPDLQNELMKKPPEKVANSHLVQVAILGVPNAGKSTLVNKLSGWNTCSVSSKVHTTRKTSKTMLIVDETQVVFLDTPGLVGSAETKKYKLESSFLVDPERALIKADVLLVLHDVGNKWTRGSLNPALLRLLHLYPNKESILVLNKIDIIKEKRLLLKLTSQLTEGMIDGQAIITTPTPSKLRWPVKKPVLNGQAVVTPVVQHLSANLTEQQVGEEIKGKIGWPRFKRVFMISALDGDGVSDIMEHLVQCARPRSWIYNEEVVTDQNPHHIVIGLVRSKLLDLLPNEIPYEIIYSIRFWEVDTSGVLNVTVLIDCKRSFVAKLVVGRGGQSISRIAKICEQELRNLFRCEVRLTFMVQP